MTTENVISQFNKYLLDKGIEGNEAIIKAAYAVLNGGKPAKAGGEAWWLGKFKDVDSFVTDFIEIAKTQDVANKWATDYENGVTEKTVAEISALFAEYVSANNITDQAEIVKAAYVVLGGDRTPIAGGVDWWVGQKLSVEDLAAKFIATARTKSEASAWANDFESGVPGEPGEPGEPSSLTEALVNLSEAKKDLADFAENIDTNGDGTPEGWTAANVDTNVAGVVTAADVAIGASVGGSYATSADSVKEVMRDQKVNDLQAALTLAQAEVDAAQAAIDAVPGLAAAVEALQQASKEATEADDAKDLSDADVAGKAVTAGTLDGSATYTYTPAVAADILASENKEASSDKDLVKSDAAGTPVIIKLVNGAVVVTADGKKADGSLKDGVADLVAAIEANLIDIKAVAVAGTNLTEAQNQVHHLDLNGAAAKSALEAVGEAMTTTPANKKTPTLSEIEAEIDALTEGIQTLASDIALIAWDTDIVTTQAKLTALLDAAIADKLITTANKVAITTAFDPADATEVAAKITATNAVLLGNADPDNAGYIVTGANTLKPGNDAGFAKDLAAFNAANGTASTATDSPLSNTLSVKLTGVETAEGNIETFQGLLDALQDAKALAAELKDYNDAIEAAQKALTDADYKLPVELKAGNTNATADNDVFMLSDVAKAGAASAVTVNKFGDKGVDYLFIGEGYKLVDLGDDAITKAGLGDAAAPEVFYKQTSTGLELYIEQESFAGSATGNNDIVAITLVGVNVDDVSIDGGFISAGTIA